MDDVRLFMNRGDYVEETYYSFSYSPILMSRARWVALLSRQPKSPLKF